MEDILGNKNVKDCNRLEELEENLELTVSHLKFNFIEGRKDI